MRKIALAACMGLLFTAGTAEAAAIIVDGNVKLGVDSLGQLNVDPNDIGLPDDDSAGGTNEVGLRYVPTNNEATAPGCLCEGWGVGIGGGVSGVDSGYANNDVFTGGTAGLSLVSFASTASTATSEVLAASGNLRVVHDFALAAETNDLYRVTVSITNESGSDIANLLYRRVMDWDVEPDAFNEYSTIQGGAAATAVLRTSNDGFISSDPLSSAGPSGGIFGGPFVTGDFVDQGPYDHGAAFDFDFGALADGETLSFDIFYGGSETEFDALVALNAVGAEVYSLGQFSADPAGRGLSGTNTFIFGFSGVGGNVVEVIPEPSTFALFGLGAFGLVGLARRRRRKAAINKTEE